MTDHSKTLGLGPSANHDEIKASLEEQFAAREARCGRASDLHTAHAVLGDVGIRHAYVAVHLGHDAARNRTRRGVT